MNSIRLKTIFFTLICFIAVSSQAQTMSLTLITPVCSGGSGSAQVSFTGVSYPFTLYWNGSGVQYSSVVITASPQTITINSSSRGYAGSGGTRAYFYDDKKNNFGSHSVGITYDAFQSINLTCNGGALALNNLAGGTAPYTIRIKDNMTGNMVDSGASPVSLKYNPICSGGYANIRVTVTDANGCGASIDSMYVGCKGLDISTTNSPASCTNGVATITGVTGGVKPYTYLWKNAATTPQISGLTRGVYTCTVADSNGCASDVNVYVAQNPYVSVNVTSTPATCVFADGKATAFAAGGTAPYSYLWDNTATTQTTNALTGGSHTVKIQDANGCLGEGYVFVSTVSPVNVTYSSTTSSCTSPTGSVTLSVSGGTTPYTYKWYGNSSTTGVISNVNQGSYSFLVTDAVGCERTGTVVVSPVSTITAKAYVSHAICPATTGSASLSVSGTAPPYTYLWSNSSTGTSISNVAMGGYTCKVTDANLCEQTVYAYVGQESPVQVGIGTKDASCVYLSDGEAVATAYNGTAPYTFRWSNGGNTYKVTGLQTMGYSVVVTDANGCTGYSYGHVGYDKNDRSCYCIIKGKVYNDANGNCTQDAGEDGIANLLVGAGTGGYTATDDNGNYSFRVRSGTYTIQQSLPPFTKLASCQADKVVKTVTASSTCTETIDFADTQTMYHDLHIYAWSRRPPIPGNDHIQELVVANMGNGTENGIRVNYSHDNTLSFNSSNLANFNAPNSSYPNDYVLNSIVSLRAGKAATYPISFFTPTNLPLGTNMYMVDTTAYKSPIHTYWMTNEETPWNNRHDIYPVVVSSYDPNSKEVFPRGDGEHGIIDLDVKNFRYVVHFENNGTANAQKVVVVDTLDEDLDIESFRIVHSSHKMNVHISKDRVATFTFDNIDLSYTPVGVYNPLAQGVLSYTINARSSSVKPGTRLASTAGIYFDYNAPVFTNKPENNYVWNSSVDQNGIVQKDQIRVYPNPAGDLLNVYIPGTGGTRQNLEVFNMQGQLVMSQDVTDTSLQLNITSLDQGVYYIRVTSATGEVSGIKFVKI